MIQLGKTDFIQFLSCPQSLWLRKHAPDEYPEAETSIFLQRLIADGYSVERHVRALFGSRGGSSRYGFQVGFQSGNGLLARADVLEFDADGRTLLYEVKSSTSVKPDHIKDVCFQTIVAEQAGQKIDGVSIIYLNKQYVRQGDVRPDELLSIEDVTVQTQAMRSETETEIEAALSFLSAVKIDRSSCSCRWKSRSNHCDTFSIFNADVPENSIYNLPRLAEKKRIELLELGILNLHDLSDDYELSPQQRAVVQATKSGAPVVDVDAISTFLNALTYPLYFFDYETYASAIPVVDGISPYEHLPVQYSLHVMSKNGNLHHVDYLAEDARLPLTLVETMRRHVGKVGNLVSWHATFEKSRNQELAARYPEHAGFLNGLNDRMVDLEELFKTAYVDARFNGYTSIKKVLPVLCPGLSYSELEVRDGTGAMEAWARLVAADTSGEERTHIAQALKRYCALDTLAMVEIFRFLQRLI